MLPKAEKGLTASLELSRYQVGSGTFLLPAAELGQRMGHEWGHLLLHLLISWPRMPKKPSGQSCTHLPYWRMPSRRMSRKSFCWQVEQPFSSEQMMQPVQLLPAPVPTASQTGKKGGGEHQHTMSCSDCLSVLFPGHNGTQTKLHFPVSIALKCMTVPCPLSSLILSTGWNVNRMFEAQQPF